MISVRPFKSKNRDKIYLEASNPYLKRVVIEIFKLQHNQWTIMFVYSMKSSRELE